MLDLGKEKEGNGKSLILSPPLRSHSTSSPLPSPPVHLESLGNEQVYLTHSTQTPPPPSSPNHAWQRGRGEGGIDSSKYEEEEWREGARCLTRDGGGGGGSAKKASRRRGKGGSGGGLPLFFSFPIVPRRFSSAKAGEREGPDREFSFPFLSNCAVTSTRVKKSRSVLFRRKAKKRGSVCASRQNKYSRNKASLPPVHLAPLLLLLSYRSSGKETPSGDPPLLFQGRRRRVGRSRERVPASTTTSGGGGGGGLTCGRGKGIPPLSPPRIFFPRLLACYCLLCSAGFCLYERELKLPRPPQPQRWKIGQGTRDAHASPFPRKKVPKKCPPKTGARIPSTSPKKV